MRRVVLDAGLTVLGRDGAAGLTVRAVAAQAGCSTTGVYTYFGGKHGLVEAMYLEGFLSFRHELATPLAAGDLVEAGRRFRRWALANSTHYLVMFGRAVPDFEPGDEAMATAQASFTDLVDAVRRAGAAEPSEAAYHLFATVHGYVMLELVGMGPADPAELDDVYESGLARCVVVAGDGSPDADGRAAVDRQDRARDEA
jgi:AcrR family transcriptional regulator